MKNRQSISLMKLNLAGIFKNLLGIFRSKTTAVLLGMSGVGVLGQALTFFSVQSRLLIVGLDTILNNRLSKLSEESDRDEYYATISLTVVLVGIINILSVSIILLFADSITYLVFDDLKYISVLILLAILGPIHVIAYLFEVITQANSDFKRLVFGRNVGSATGIVTIIPFIYYLGIEGVIWNIMILTIVKGVYFGWINKIILRYLSFKVYKNSISFFSTFFKLAFTDLIRKSIVFISLLLFRIIIVKYLGLEKSGLFQAIWSIAAFSDIITAAFVSFYFPVISGIKINITIQKEMVSNFEYLLYMIFPIIGFIILFSDGFLLLLFNRSFVKVSFELQLLTFLKFFESIYLFFSITLIGRSRLKAFLSAEILTYAGLIVSAYFLIPYLDFFGTILSIAFKTLISLSVIVFILVKNPEFHLPRKTVVLLTKFILLLIIAFVPSYGNIFVRLIGSVVIIVTAMWILEIDIYKDLLKSTFTKS